MSYNDKSKHNYAYRTTYCFLMIFNTSFLFHFASSKIFKGWFKSKTDEFHHRCHRLGDLHLFT